MMGVCTTLPNRVFVLEPMLEMLVVGVNILRHKECPDLLVSQFPDKHLFPTNSKRIVGLRGRLRVPFKMEHPDGGRIIVQTPKRIFKFARAKHETNLGPISLCVASPASSHVPNLPSSLRQF